MPINTQIFRSIAFFVLVATLSTPALAASKAVWSIQIVDETFGRQGTIFNEDVETFVDGQGFHFDLHERNSPSITTARLVVDVEDNGDGQLIAIVDLDTSGLNGAPQIAPAFSTKYLLRSGGEIEIEFCPAISGHYYSLWMKLLSSGAEI